MARIRIEISNHADSFYDSWHEYYEWNGKQWVYHDEGFENESGMMGAFNRSEYHKTREDLTDKDRLLILGHFKLTGKQVPLNKVPTTSLEHLEGILLRKG